MTFSSHCKLPRRQRPRAAFTYVEVVITALIMGIVASVAVPKYLDNVDRYRVEMAGKRLSDDLAYAQRVARQSGNNAVMTISSASHWYQIAQIQSLDHPTQAYQVSLSGTPYKSTIEKLIITADPNTNLTSTTITFDRFGAADRAVTLTLRSGKYRRTYSVDARSGRVTQQ